jgi:hypothetical protein
MVASHKHKAGLECSAGELSAAGRPLHWWCIWAVWLLVFSSALAEAQEWSFSGLAKVRMYSPGRTQEQSTVLFTVKTRGCDWLVRFVRDEGTNAANASDYEEASFDGTNVYYLCNFKEKLERQRRAGDKFKAPNVAVGRAYQGELFHHRMALEVGPIWLTYASGCYFRSRTNDQVEPAMLFDGSGITYGPPKHPKLSARWALTDSSPSFPVRVAYFSSGEIQSPNGRVARPRPYNAGFTNAIYQVEAFTNMGGLMIPCRSSLKVFKMRADATANTDLALFVEYRVDLTNIVRSIDITSFQPEIPGVTLLEDARFGQLNYFASNGWPEVSTLQTGAYFTAVRNINKRQARVAPSTVFVRVCLGVLILLPVAIFLVRKMFIGNQPRPEAAPIEEKRQNEQWRQKG